jgi:hypothetical protein
MKNRLGIALRLIAMTRSFHFPAEDPMVVDLSIEGNPHAVVLIRHRLVAARNIDDRQTAMSETDRPIEPQARAVRPSMLLDLRHPHQTSALRPITHIALHNPGNGAHGQAASLSVEENANRR